MSRVGKVCSPILWLMALVLTLVPQPAHASSPTLDVSTAADEDVAAAV